MREGRVCAAKRACRYGRDRHSPAACSSFVRRAWRASFTLSFTPNASGGATGSASFVSNASNSPIQELFAGTGSVPVNHSVTLSWNPDSSPVAGYNVYRGSASAGPFSRINSALDVTTGFNDANVQSGQTYYYAVTAVNSSGLESGYSNSVRAVIP